MAAGGPQAEEDVVQAKAKLAQRKTPNFDGRIPDTSVQEEDVARAKDRLGLAEEQVEVCRKWAVRLPKMVSEEYEGPASGGELPGGRPAGGNRPARPARIEACTRTPRWPPAPPAAAGHPGGPAMKVDAGRGKAV